MIALRDLGPLLQLRWGIVLAKPGKAERLIAAFADERQAEAYRIERRKAEERVG